MYIFTVGVAGTHKCTAYNSTIDGSNNDTFGAHRRADDRWDEAHSACHISSPSIIFGLIPWCNDLIIRMLLWLSNKMKILNFVFVSFINTSIVHSILQIKARWLQYRQPVVYKYRCAKFEHCATNINRVTYTFTTENVCTLVENRKMEIGNSKFEIQYPGT